MNKLEFNDVLSSIGPLAADAYSQDMTVLLPSIVLPSLHFEVCTEQHFSRAESWPDTSAHKDGYGGWSWEDIYHKSKYSPKKFVIAVSSNGVFGGLFSGKLLTTDVELQFVQRDIGCTSLKGFMIPASITYSAILGQVMSRDVLSVCEPAPDIVERYQKSMKGDVNFTFGQKGDVIRMSVPVDEVVSPSTD
ncbi:MULTISPECIES: hypothetical protein [Yersinia pseudotuberculosis complex]|nr:MULTISPECIES: hypothetical protein [Yersinia pseudotuberculosis complex]MCE4113223.1 hypothetical protein [Yersinia pseudotuberculosis]RYC26237.1 hypothetical protein EU971_11190 [Yersinia pseudotuberculosis]WLF06008.1 hypothetical protein Q6G25_21340 [Yersinia pseudotuberculosis]